MTTTTWKRLRHHKGVLSRHLPAGDPLLKMTYTVRRESAIELLRRERVEITDWSQIDRMLKRDGMGLGGTIEDIIESKLTWHRVDGVVVAALKLLVYISFSPATARDAGCEEGVSDGITLLIYRDPIRPRTLRCTY